MDVAQAIKSRTSIRDFSDKPVEREKILTCLEAARLAPSACNSQPWKFIVVDDKLLKNKLCRVAFSGVYSMNSFCKTAPVIVTVVSEKSKFIARIGELFQGTKYYLIDIGIACEHFVLQAEALGLGTCWIGWFNEKAVKSTLDIPHSKKVDVLIALGYYDREKINLEHSGRDTMEEIASFNHYNLGIATIGKYSLKKYAQNSPMELISVLKRLAINKDFKGKCEICKDWW